jgi:hypothetical protein
MYGITSGSILIDKYSSQKLKYYINSFLYFSLILNEY